jgi:hypothetical protein
VTAGNSEFYYTQLANGWTVGRFHALDGIRGIVHAVTTQKALDVDLIKTDHAAAAVQLAQAMNLQQMAFVEQVHGNCVLPTQKGGLIGEADGLVSSGEDLGLMMRGADCPLILAVDPVTRVMGSAHASWRGTTAQIAVEMISQMTGHLSAVAERIVACICPSAGPCCYQVGEDVVEAMTASIGRHATQFFQKRSDGIYLDLWAANVEQLRRCDVQEKNIHISGVCTICASDIFPSHRRQGSAAGRFAAAIGRSS